MLKTFRSWKKNLDNITYRYEYRAMVTKMLNNVECQGTNNPLVLPPWLVAFGVGPGDSGVGRVDSLV